MRKVIKAILLLALLAAPTSFVGASEEDAIRGKMQAWLDAFNTKDAERLAALYSDQIYYANNGNKLVRDTKSIIDNYRTQFASAPKVTIDFSEELVAAGPRFAHISGKYRVNVPNETGGIQNAYGRVLLIFEKIESDWLLVVDFDNQGSDLSAQTF